MKPEISTIILTYNEEKHIERCIKNAQQFSKDIYVVDSFSTDQTIAIAEALGAKVFQNKWENNYAKQFNWALEHLPIHTEWVFRLDADEYLTPELIAEIHDKLPTIEENISGIIFPLKRYFLNTYVKRGIGTMNLLRMFRYKKGICENRWMDEHIMLLEGTSRIYKNAICDHNLNNLTWWIQKHNNYSIREAVDLLNLKYGLLAEKEATEISQLSADAKAKRLKKEKYNKMPLFVRSFIYFLYRYFYLLGFTEGKEGFLWHFLQGWWYRTLVDAKIFEIEKACGNDPIKMKSFIEENYGLKL